MHSDENIHVCKLTIMAKMNVLFQKISIPGGYLVLTASPPPPPPPTCQDTPGYASYFSLNTLVYEISLPLGISFLG